MNIKQLKKELDLTNKDLAGFFDMSYMAYANSTAKKRYENALCKFYEKLIDISICDSCYGTGLVEGKCVDDLQGCHKCLGRGKFSQLLNN